MRQPLRRRSTLRRAAIAGLLATVTSLAATGPASALAVDGAPAPGLGVVLIGPPAATAGELLTYSIDVTNVGTTAIPALRLLVSLPRCQTPPVVTGRGGDPTPAELEPGETWLYTCQIATRVTDTRVDAVATTTGTDLGGALAAASASMRTDLAAPAGDVGASRFFSSRAHISGTTGCIAGRYATAAVRGARIRSVTFAVNGRTVALLTEPTALGSAYELRYRAASLPYGSYAVRATVRFATGGTPRSRTLRLRFSRCATRAVRPAFAG